MPVKLTLLGPEVLQALRDSLCSRTCAPETGLQKHISAITLKCVAVNFMTESILRSWYLAPAASSEWICSPVSGSRQRNGRYSCSGEPPYYTREG